MKRVKSLAAWFAGMILLSIVLILLTNFLLSLVDVPTNGCLSRSHRELVLHDMRLTISDKISIVLIDPGGGPTLIEGDIGTTLLATLPVRVSSRDNILQVRFSGSTTLTITHSKLRSTANGCKQSVHCYNVQWHTSNAFGTLQDEYTMTGGAHWYGAAPVYEQLWPMELWDRNPSAFVAGDSYNDQYGGVQERYWLNSHGVALHVDQDIPLFVSVNSSGSRRLSFISKYQRPFRNQHQRPLRLSYRVCHAVDITSMHLFAASGKFFQRPAGIPDERMFRYPLWSTWARYKRKIDQRKVLQVCRNVHVLAS